MSKYIDVEPIIEWAKDPEANLPYGASGVDWEQKIFNAPTIDIVRCKECRHWIGETEHYEDREYKACWQLCGQYMNSEFWCKYGEREGE